MSVSKTTPREKSTLATKTVTPSRVTPQQRNISLSLQEEEDGPFIDIDSLQVSFLILLRFEELKLALYFRSRHKIFIVISRIFEKFC